jgi:hypothetical protein
VNLSFKNGSVNLSFKNGSVNLSFKLHTHKLYIIRRCTNIVTISLITFGLGLWCLTSLPTTVQSLCRHDQFCWWRKPEDPEKTTDLTQVTDNFITQCCID